MRLLKFFFKLFKRNSSIFYMYRPLSLPEPLSSEKENELIDEMQNGSIEARNTLVEHNMRLVVFIAKKFESPKILLEDLISIGSMGLIKGVETFKKDKAIKLATYASRCIENEILMFLRKTSKLKNEVSLDETLNVDGDGNELLLEDVLGTSDSLIFDEVLSSEREKLMYEAVNKLKPREKEIIVMRFGLFNKPSYTQKEVALNLGISQSYISRLEKKIIDKLKVELEKKISLEIKIE